MSLRKGMSLLLARMGLVSIPPLMPWQATLDIWRSAPRKESP